MGTIAKVTAGGATHLVASTCYGTCTTGANTIAKVATIQDNQAFTLMTGVTVHIKFTNENSVSNPTLNINSTGAKSIYKYGTTAPSTSVQASWNAGAVISFTYDGTAWMMNDWTNESENTTYEAITKNIGVCNASVDGITLEINNRQETVVDEIVENDYYGMVIHQSISNPLSNIEYIGKNAGYTPMSVNFTTGEVNYGSWKNMPTIAHNKPAMIKRDGTLDYYLNENDYTLKADGTESDVANINYVGNAMAWFDGIYMKIIESDTDLEVRFAYKKLDDDYYEVCPDGSKGVWLPMFYGSPDSSGYMRSIANTSCLGAKTNNTTTVVQNTAIKKNGDNYYFLGGKLLDCISLLLYMWFKTTNSDNICRGNQDGYKSSDTTTYGTKVNPIVDGGQFYCTNGGKSANKILHCLPLATYDVWLRNPYVVCDKGTFKVSKDYSFSSTADGYTDTGLTAPGANGYQKQLTYVPGFGLLPKVCSGASTTTYWSDYYWINLTIVAFGLSFGHCSDGRSGGLRALYCGYAVGRSTWGCGCAFFLKQLR